MLQLPAELTALHALRTNGFLDTARLADILGTDADRVAALLDVLAARGEVRRLERPRARGWSLLSAGRKRHADAFAELDHDMTALRSSYDRLLPLNRRFKNLCTTWQNSTDSGGSPAPVMTELGEIHHGVLRIVADAAAEATWFAGYPDRFTAAFANVRSGDHRFLTGTQVDSYHSIWFALHEDFLVTLGIDRSSEPED